MAIVRDCELKLVVCRCSDSVCMLYDCSLLVCKKGNIPGWTYPDLLAKGLADCNPDFPMP